MDTSNINAISVEESRRCLPHEEELVIGIPLVLFNPCSERRYALTTTAEESKRYYSDNVVLLKNQHKVDEEAADIKYEKEVVEKQLEVNACSDEERQHSEESKQNAQESEPRKLGQRSTAKQEKTKKRSADNNRAKISREDREKQMCHRGTLRYELEHSIDKIPPPSEEKCENTKQKEPESSKGTPCYSLLLSLLGTVGLVVQLLSANENSQIPQIERWEEYETGR